MATGLKLSNVEVSTSVTRKCNAMKFDWLFHPHCQAFRLEDPSDYGSNKTKQFFYYFIIVPTASFASIGIVTPAVFFGTVSKMVQLSPRIVPEWQAFRTD